MQFCVGSKIALGTALGDNKQCAALWIDHILDLAVNYTVRHSYLLELSKRKEEL